jgi:hypothetical protein
MQTGWKWEEMVLADSKASAREAAAALADGTQASIISTAQAGGGRAPGSNGRGDGGLGTPQMPPLMLRPPRRSLPLQGPPPRFQ